MQEQQHTEGLTLFGPSGNRKYLNAAERTRFERAAARAPPRIGLFCLTLRWTGGRISEVLALAPSSFDLDAGVVSIETLKRRRRGIVRQVPLPSALLTELDREFHLSAVQHDPNLAHRRLWLFSRTTAWRYVKGIMAAAGIIGASAMPKGLRHSFCVNAIQSHVPLPLVQRWLGHASLKTTGIYADLAGPDERAFAREMWGTAQPNWLKASIKRAALALLRLSRSWTPAFVQFLVLL